MQNNRDRLIGLLEQAKIKAQDTIGSMNNGFGAWYADYLLEHGAIVPQCKVGDVVYQVTRNFISEFRVRFVEIATCGNLFLHTDLISGIVYTGEVFSESDIGKTVFLTREEAEKALEDMRKKDDGK